MNTKFVKVGMTGGIGCGKSHVEAACRNINADYDHKPLFVFNDADKIVHHLYSPLDKTGTRNQIVKEFGDVLGADGNIDRKVLGKIIFPEGSEKPDFLMLDKLNALMDIPVKMAIGEWFSKVEWLGYRIAVVTIPWLFEAKMKKAFDWTICIGCSESTQMRRLVDLRGLTTAKAKAMMAAQWSVDTKMTLSDFVVWNNAEDKDPAPQLKAILNWILNESMKEK